MKAPEIIETERLRLRRPDFSDAQAIFSRYASDADVTKFLSWPRHESIDDTRAFLEFSRKQWERAPAGPYLIALPDGSLIGSTGLEFETKYRASTGYVLAKDSWGRGYATEALRALLNLAEDLGLRRIYALCHPNHQPSSHVLQKCGFELEGTLRCYCEFPNLDPGVPADACCYARVL